MAKPRPSMVSYSLIILMVGVSDDLLVGDPVYAIGNPLGTELLNTFTNGIVSAINRDVNVDGVNMTFSTARSVSSSQPTSRAG